MTALAGELADGVIIPGGNSPEDVRAAVGHFRDGRASRPGAGSGSDDTEEVKTTPTSSRSSGSWPARSSPW
jgi:hypothetical protein